MSLAALRPLAFGELLDQSFGLYRKLFASLMIISLVANAIPALLSIVAGMMGNESGAGLGLSILGMVLSIVGAAIGTGASTFLVSDYLLSRPADANDALRRAMPRIGALIACSILFGFVVGLGTIALIVPGLIALSGLALAFTAVTVEGVTGSDSLGRSWELTKGFKWRVLGLLCVFGAIFYGLIIGTSVVAGVVVTLTGGTLELESDGAGGPMPTFLLLVTVASSLIQIVIYPVLYCMVVTLYYDLRVRKEGFDLELLATTMEQPAVR